MASFVAELEGQVIAGKYRLGELIGRGGFGAVYRGEHLAMQRSVAIKLLDARSRGAGERASTTHRFSREAKVISQLESSSTITVYDYGVEGGLCYLIMEFVDGHSLKELLAQVPVLDANRVVRIAIQILDSLDEAHHYNILHRDLKPANVMLTRDFRGHERVKVVDFGIAKVFEDLRDASSQGGDQGNLTQEGAFIGTPRYAAPEQLFAQQLSPATDVYSVGVMMWEMLVGEPLLQGSSWYDCSRYHLEHQREPMRLPASIQRTLAELIERALERRWTDRWENADAMKQALIAWLGQHGVDIADVGGSFSAPPPASEQLESAAPGFFDESIDEDSLVFVRGKSVMDPNVGESVDPSVVEFESWGSGGDDLFGELGDELGFERSPQSTRPEPHRALERDSFFHDSSPSRAGASWDEEDFDTPRERESWRGASELVTESKQAALEPAAPTAAPRAVKQQEGRTANERARRAAAVGSARSAAAKKKVILFTSTTFLVGTVLIFAALLGPKIIGQVGAPEDDSASPKASVSSATTSGLANSHVLDDEALTEETADDVSGEYSSEGILLAIQGAKWKGSSEPIVTDLGSIVQESLLFERGPERCEVTIIQAKSQEQLEAFNKAADPRTRTLWFGPKLVKITPLGESSLLCASDIAQVLRRYKDIVDSRE